MEINPGICTACGEYARNLERCPCKEFAAWIISYEDETKIWARDAQEAAEKFAREYDEGGDYPIVGCGNEDIGTRCVLTGAIKRFRVDARMEPVYNARAID